MTDIVAFDDTQRVLAEAKRHLERRGVTRDHEVTITLATLRGLLEARVIVPGPAVTGRIEERS